MKALQLLVGESGADWIWACGRGPVHSALVLQLHCCHAQVASSVSGEEDLTVSQVQPGLEHTLLMT